MSDQQWERWFRFFCWEVQCRWNDSKYCNADFSGYADFTGGYEYRVVRTDYLVS